MLIDGQLIEVKVVGKTLKHYRDLGYDVKCLDIIKVPPEHLTNGSHCDVRIICDVCHKEFSRPYKTYLLCHMYNYDTCDKCKDSKAKETCLEKYGVNTHMLVPEIQEKFKNVIYEKYGVDYISQIDTAKEQKKQTCLKNFGVENPMYSEALKAKLEQTNIEKYGCKNPHQNEEVKRKTELTNIKKYGVKNPNQNPIIKEKAMRTMKKNGNVPTSKQQLSLCEIIKTKYPDAILNHPFGTCSLDVFICVDNIKIDIEYDGSFWHTDQQRDIRRDKYLQSQGFKILRIRSGRMMPTNNELFEAVDYLVNTKHHFKEIILKDWQEGDKNESLFNYTTT